MFYHRVHSSLALLVLGLTLVACGSPNAGGAIASGTPAVGADVGAAPTPAVNVLNPERIKIQANTTTDYYTVYGSNSDEIFAYIAANGPRDDKGNAATGLTTYNPTLTWMSNRNQAACAIASMTIQVDLKVLLPSLNNLAGLPQPLQNNWKTFSEGVAAHEQRHVDIWLQGADSMRQKMLAIQPMVGCSALEAAVNNVWHSVEVATDAEQEAFHRDDKARTDAARAPLTQKIEANRKELDSLTAQVSSLDSTLAVLATQVDSLQSQLNSLKDQLTAIEQKYQGTGAPDDVVRQYDALRAQHNNLVPAYNALIEQYNAQARQRNTLVTQSEVLRASTNALVDQYNWTR